MLRRFLALLLLASLCACTPQPRPPLILGTNLWPGYEPLYLARQQGLLPATAVHLIEYGSSTEVMRAFRNGVIDAATLSLDEALLLAQYIPDLRIVLVMSQSRGGDAVLAGSQVKNFADLRGRRVGVESTALGAYILARALDFNRMSLADIVPVSLPVNEHEQGFLRGDVDAVVSCEPVRSKLLAQGAQILFDSRQLQDEVIDVLVVRPDRMAAHRAQLSQLLEVWFQVLDHMRAQPSRSASLMGEREGLPADAFLNTLRGFHFLSVAENQVWLSGSPSRLDVQRKRFTQFMRAHALLDANGSMPLSDASMVLQLPLGKAAP